MATYNYIDETTNQPTTTNPPVFLDMSKVNISLDRIGRYLTSATLTITAKEAGDTFGETLEPIRKALIGTGQVVDPNDPAKVLESVESGRNQGNNLVPGVAAEYVEQLSAIRIPIDPGSVTTFRDGRLTNTE